MRFGVFGRPELFTVGLTDTATSGLRLNAADHKAVYHSTY